MIIIRGLTRRGFYIGLLVTILTAIVFFSALSGRALQRDHLFVDEHITIDVSRHIEDTATLNTNWADIPSLSHVTYADQYNFSSSIIAYHFWSKFFSSSNADYKNLRLAALTFAALSLVFFYLFFQQNASELEAIIAVALSYVSYQLISESIQARPEAFILCLYGLSLLLVCLARGTRGVTLYGLWLASGACAGLLVASKFSLLFVCAQVLVFSFLFQPSSSNISTIARVFSFSFGCFLGLFAGAPYAVSAPIEALNGVLALLKQYGGPHLPFGRPDFDVFGRFIFASKQTLSHLGVATIGFAVYGLIRLWRAKRWSVFFLCASSILFATYFMVKPVFFARNFSFTIPIIGFAAAIGIAELCSKLRGRKAKLFASISVMFVCMAQPLIATKGVLGAADSFAEREKLRMARGTYFAHAMNYELRSIVPTSVDELLEQYGSTESVENIVFEAQRFNDPYTETAILAFSRLHDLTTINASTDLLSKYPQSMIHYNFDQYYIHLFTSPLPSTLLPPLVPLSITCAATEKSSVFGEFEPSGLHPDVEYDFPVYGSWLNGDEAFAESGIRVLESFEDLILPIYTGPGPGGQQLMLGKANVPIFTREVWLGISLGPVDAGEVIQIEDSGNAWGQWIAFGQPREICN